MIQRPSRRKQKQVAKNKCVQAHSETEETPKDLFSISIYSPRVLWRVALSRCQTLDVVSLHSTQQSFPSCSHPLRPGPGRAVSRCAFG